MRNPVRAAPLNALRAFEAAARHLSFTIAARDLHVTAGAVSRQVKLLEEYLGVALFRRLARAPVRYDLVFPREALKGLPVVYYGAAHVDQHEHRNGHDDWHPDQHQHADGCP